MTWDSQMGSFPAMGSGSGMAGGVDVAELGGVLTKPGMS